MPYPVQEAGFIDALRKRFRIQGYVRAQLIDDLFPMVDVLQLPEDMKHLVGVHRFRSHASTAAVAAQFGFSALVNPAGSNHLLTLEGWQSMTADSFELQNDGGGVAAQAGLTHDFRYPNPAGFTDGALDAGTGGGGLPDIRLVLGWNPFTFIIPPGHNIRLVCATVNVPTDVTWVWTSRPLTPEE